MKKKIVRLMLCTGVALALAGCGGKEPFTCGICQKEKTEKKHIIKVLGEEVEICKDCKKNYDDFQKELRDAFK